MAKKVDAKAAALAAAQGSGAVFEALADEVEATAAAAETAKPVFENIVEDAAAASESSIEDSITMNAQTFASTFGVPAFEAATAKVRTMFDAPAMVERTQRLAQEAAELAKSNLEAMTASARIAAQNAGTLTQDVAAASRKSFESASEGIKGLAEAKTPAELLRLQGEFAKTYLETMIAEGARLSETLVKLTGEAMQPVQSQMAANAARVKALGE